MKKYYKYIAVFSAIVMFNCEADDESKLSNYVGFELSPTSVILDQNSTSTVDVKIYASEVKSSDRTYAIQVDESNTTLATAYSVPATVTIPANTNEGTLSVSITDDENLSFDAESQVLTIDFVDAAGISNGGNFEINVSEACPNIYVTLAITTDDYPDETSWEIYDLNLSTDTAIYSGGPYDGDTNTTLSFEYCLLASDYAVVVYDSYGDGGSSYTVTSGSTVFVESTSLVSENSVSFFTVD